MICCPSASGAFRPITETRPALLSRWPPAARSDVETRPSDTLIIQQSHGAKSWGAEVLCFAREMARPKGFELLTPTGRIIGPCAARPHARLISRHILLVVALVTAAYKRVLWSNFDYVEFWRMTKRK